MTTVVFGDNTGDDYSGSDGNNIHSSAPNSVQGGALDISRYLAGDHRNGLLSFSGMSALPSSITVSSAILRAYLSVAGGGNHVFTGWRSLRNWVLSEATWNQYSSGNNWTTGGAEGSGSDRASSSSSTSESIPATTGVYYQLLQDAAQLRSDVQDIASGANPNYGWIINRTDSQDDSTYRVFSSTDDADGQRPYLTVVYTTGGGGAAAQNYLTLLGVG